MESGKKGICTCNPQASNVPRIDNGNRVEGVGGGGWRSFPHIHPAEYLLLAYRTLFFYLKKNQTNKREGGRGGGFNKVSEPTFHFLVNRRNCKGPTRPTDRVDLYDQARQNNVYLNCTDNHDAAKIKMKYGESGK